MRRPANAKARLSFLVEGVEPSDFFSANVLSWAQQRSVYGYVRPLTQGRMEIEAEAERSILGELLRFVEEPEHGQVTKRGTLDVRWMPYLGEFRAFQIRK